MFTMWRYCFGRLYEQEKENGHVAVSALYCFFWCFFGAYAINQLLQLRELGCFYIFGFVWFCNDL